MRGHRVKLKYESPNKEIYKGDYSGEELEYSYVSIVNITYCLKVLK